MNIIKFLIPLFFFCFGFLSPPVAAAEPPETVTLQLKWFHQYQFAGYYAAIEKGFYKEEGLNVILKERDPEKGYVQAVLDGDAVYGTGNAGLLLDRSNGKPVVVLKQIFQHSPLVFLSLKSSGITGPEQMVDRKVMFKPEEDAPLLAMLLETLGSLKKIKTVPFTFDHEDLITGKVDVISAYITSEPFYFEQQLIPINIINPQNYGIDFYGDNLFTTEEEIRKHPERVDKIIRATLKGWEYALAHPEEMIDLIIKRYNSKLSREHLAYEARLTHQMILPEVTPLGTVTPQRYEQIGRIYENVCLSKLPVDLCAFIYQCPEYVKHPSGLGLTSEERAWIDKHPVVRARIGNAPPLHYFDEKPRGISVDYLDLIAKRAGFQVQYIDNIPWSKALDDIKKHETIDLLLTANATPERRKYMAFTKNYLLMPRVIFTQKDSTIGTMEDLTDKSVAIERDFVMHKKLVAEYPHIKLLVKGTSKEAIEAVATGDADAYIGNLTIGVYLIRQNHLNNIKVAASTPFGNHDQAMAIRNDWPELAGIIDKGLASISDKERNEILTGYLGILSPLEFQTAQPRVALTPEERAWLRDHPGIKVALAPLPPYQYREGEQFTGYQVEMLQAMLRQIGLVPEFSVQPLKEELEKLRNGEADVGLDLFYTEERARYLAFSEKTIDVQMGIFVHNENTDIKDLKSLKGRSIASHEGYGFESILKKLLPDARFVRAKDVVGMLRLVASGEADAAVQELHSGEFLLRENLINNVQHKGILKIPGKVTLLAHEYATRKDLPLLKSILDKSYNSLEAAEKQRIWKKWFVEDIAEPAESIPLTREEKEWISKHKVLRFGTAPQWAPFNFVDDAGKFRGIMADIFSLLSNRLGLSFNLVPGLTWVKVLDAARERRLDIVSSVTETPERATYLNFSNPLTSAPWVIVTEKDFRDVKDLGDMAGKKVAMAKGYAIIELSRKAFPDLSIHTVASPIAGLEAIMSRQVDAYVGNLGVISYLIQQNGLTNLRIAAAAGVKAEPFAIGVRSDWPELVSILNKGLAAISREEMNVIYKRWIPVEMKTIQAKGETRLSFRRLAAYGVTFFLILGLLAWLVFKKSSRMGGMAAGFGSARFRLVVLVGLTLFVVVILLIGWFSLTRIKSGILEDVGKKLTGTLLIAKKGLGIWEDGRKAFVRQLGHDPELVAFTERLLRVSPDTEALSASKPLQEIRNYFKENKNIFPNLGFFIISPENISIGSARDANLGTPNLISQQYPKLIQQALEGEVGFVPPVESDVQLGKVSKSDAKKPPTMFFVGPIRKPDGKIIAVMTLRVDPSKDFSRIMGIVGGGGTEETYAFTEEGRLISDSKFDEQLREIGLIDEGEKAVLNMEIRDPGGNMVEGYRPEIERSRQPLTHLAAGAIALKTRMKMVGAEYGHSEIEMDMAGYRDYRGVPAFGAWVWDANLELGIGTEIDVDDALSSYYRIRVMILVLLGLTIVLFVGGTLFLLRMGERTNRVLSKARDELEDKVEDRTRELEENQERLSVAEERSRLLLDSAGEGIFGVDKEGRCTFANPAALEMLGYSQDEIVGQEIHNLIHHSYADGNFYPAVGCPMSKAYTHGETETISDEMLWRKDGAGFLVEYTATPISQDGKITGAVITFGDITERKRAEEALRESEERFALTTSGSGDGLWDFDLPDELFWYSDRFRELLGYTNEEDYPNRLESWSDGLHPEDRDKTLAAFEAHLELAKPYDVEYRLKTQQGEWRWFRARGKSLRDENGRSYRAAGSITDIHEQKEAEVELRKLSMAVEQSPASVVITNLQGNIEYVNDKFCQVTGYTVKEAVGANPRVLKSGEMPPEIYEDLWKTISAGKEWRGELLNRKRNDELYWEAVSISPITSADGSITHYLAVKEDISERKQMEDELHSRITELDEAQSAMLNMMEDLDEEKQKAEEATKAKGDFLANMSHEIRTPMNAILGMSHLALNTDLNTKQRDYVNKIQSSANSLLGIINDILDFSKIDAGKLDMEKINFSLDDVLENVSNLIGVKSQEKGLELLFDTAQEAPPYLVGDPLRLGQVLINLGNNAVKFTEKGEIVISTELVEQKNDKIELRFTVKDSGIGLTEEQQGKLFQAFSQADTSTTRKYGGTGLGLTISKRLVNLMGGDIWVESVAGEGASFIFTVVFRMGKEKEKSALIPEPDLVGLKVLVVDDNATSLEILEGMLTSMTFKVTLAASGMEGLEVLKKADADQPFDLVIMDWKMPGMDGLKASRKIREELTLKTRPRLIMVTAYGREEIMKQAERFGLDGFITKPVAPSLLFDTIMAAFGKEARRDSKMARKDGGIEELSGIRGARVLVAEDNEINQQVAREILESAGLIVDIAENGEKAVAAVAQNPYDVVLMDIQMPIMSGYEASREIKKDERFNDLPIIAMTANAMTGDREKAIEAGMIDHVAKPIDVKVLFSALLKFIKPGERELPSGMEGQQKGPEKEEERPLPDLAGIDTTDGLARVGGSKEFYRKILKKFRAGNLGVMEKIQEEVARKDLDQAERLVHGVKGASGNIGATELFESARILDDALKLENTEGLDSLVEAFSTAFEVALGSIAELEALDEESAKDVSAGPTSLDMDRVKEIMARLKELLEDDDAEAANVLDSLKEQLKIPEAQLYLKELAAHISGYDFEEALESLESLAGILKIDMEG